MSMDWPGSGELRAGTASKKQQHKYTYLATYGLFVSFFRMRQFYDAYANDLEVSPLVAQVPWTHNLLILGQCKRAAERVAIHLLPKLSF
jgi:hypothetical protein